MENSKNIKAVFFDIDGTLVSFKTHRMPDSTRKALDRLREKGILTFIATGRRMGDINNIGDWKPDGFVSLNGSYCIVGDEVLHKHSIAPSDIDNFASRLENGSKFHPFVFIDEHRSYINYQDEKVTEMMRMINLDIPRTISPAELRKTEIFQMLGFFTPEEEREVMALLPNCHTTRWTDIFADIVPAGTNKWNGISKIIERFGIAPEETMAFGDGGNDIDMLVGAGIGVAMGNADPHVKRSADYVTTSVDRNGITKALEYFRIL